MRTVVTGAAGFIASNLISRLLAEGQQILALDNFFLGKQAYLQPFLQHPLFRFVEVDLIEADAVVALFQDFKPDRVWHLAANSDISYGTVHTDFDLKGGTVVTYNVLEAMRLAGAREILFSSSGAVYGEPLVVPTPEDYGPLFPISLYAASKLACEGLISAFSHNYDISSWIFRFGNIVGPNPTHGVIYDFIHKLQGDPSTLRVLGDGTQAKPYVHVTDCLDGMMYGHTKATMMFNCFNLAVDGQTSVADIAAWTIEAMGLPAESVRIEYSGGSRGWKGDVAQVRLDVDRMSALGWRPVMNSDDAVRRAIIEMVAQMGKSAQPA